MKKDELIKMLELGGATKCDMGINTVYMTTDKLDNSQVYIYIKRSDALEKPFFGLQATILESLACKNYFVVLLDGMNKKAYVLDKEDIKNIMDTREPNNSGAYLVNLKDLNNAVDEDELVRFFDEEVSVFNM